MALIGKRKPEEWRINVCASLRNTEAEFSIRMLEVKEVYEFFSYIEGMNRLEELIAGMCDRYGV